ncbi:MAG: hypothetical protein WC310_05245 [Patescibacteria group bacterium]|jgi:hypothetical protein
MAEKFSKSIEGEKKPERYQIIKNEVLENHDDGSKTEQSTECNGSLHRRCVDKIYYDESGNITFADQLSMEELGLCDCGS